MTKLERDLLAALKLARPYVAKVVNPKLNPDLAKVDKAIKAASK